MRLKTLAFALAACCATALPAQAEMESAFGNTVVSHYPDGSWVKHLFDRDGSYRAVFSDGRRLTARWAVEGERVCLNGIRPRMLLGPMQSYSPWWRKECWNWVTRRAPWHLCAACWRKRRNLPWG